MVHDDVVACPGHSRDSAVETGAGPAEDRCEVARIEFVGSGFRTHGAEHIDAHVEKGAVEVDQEPARNAGLSRARDSVEEDDPAGSGYAGTTVAALVLHASMVTRRWVVVRHTVRRTVAGRLPG
nr:hypothetical protein [Nocardia carnea]